MKAVIQRVLSASVHVDNKTISRIKNGLCIFLGVEENDSEDEAIKLAKKIVSLRIFEDENGKMNLSVTDIKGEILVVSQFTLLADCSTGRRPSFSGAGSPKKANDLYLFFSQTLKDLHIPTKNGIFGADMSVRLENNGPATFVLETSR